MPFGPKSCFMSAVEWRLVSSTWLDQAWPQISLNSLVVKRSCDSNHHRTSSDGCWASFSNTILPNFLVAINLFSVEDCDCQNQQIGFYVIVARYLTTGWDFCEDRPKIGSFPTLRMLAMLLNQKTGWNLIFFLQTVSYYQKFYNCFTAALIFNLNKYLILSGRNILAVNNFSVKWDSNPGPKDWRQC